MRTFLSTFGELQSMDLSKKYSDSESQSEDNASDASSFSPPYAYYGSGSVNELPRRAEKRTNSAAFSSATHSTTSDSESDATPYSYLPSASDDEGYSPKKKRFRSDSQQDDSVFSTGQLQATDFTTHTKKMKKVQGMELHDPQSFVRSSNAPNMASTSNYSSAAAKMMASMGYKEGAGLGARGQGIVEPVASSTQKGRRGLGTQVTGFEPTSDTWDFEKEEVFIEEEVDWLPSCNQAVPDYTEMLSWIKVGKKKHVIDDETEFCSEDTLGGVLSAKTVFDNLEGYEMRRARTKSNPYETIRGAFFQNRAAMKMANMDRVLDFMFTSPTDERGAPKVSNNDILYFADICAGPGGFSEYVLWRKGIDVKGFGFTLRGENDFKLSEFHAAPAEFFEPHYGVHNDGDIYSSDNQICFRDFVKDHTQNKGVHFVMADGGFSVDGKENIQEILSKRLYLCQFLVALSILRPDGHFVCKLFDIFTPFSVGLVYLMYRAFKHVAIFKPVTSRPANSERYIVCKGLREDAYPVYKYMHELNVRLDPFFDDSNPEDINEVVPLEMMKDDEPFYQYIYDSNEILGKRQAISLLKIQIFARNANLHDPRQADVRDRCLEYWKIPNEVRQAPQRSALHVPSMFRDLFAGGDATYLGQQPKELFLPTLKSDLPCVYNHRVVVAGASDRHVIMSLGSSAVYQMTTYNKWTHISEARMELPAKTLLEVEFVQEFRGEGRGQRKLMCVHIIDGLFIAGKDIRSLHYNERIAALQRFVQTVNRATRPDLAPIRVKDMYRCENMAEVFTRLEIKLMKGTGQTRKLCYTYRHDENNSFDLSNAQPGYFAPTGLIMIRIVAEPWMLAVSKSSRRKYYFNTLTKHSMFESRAETIASHREGHTGRLIWKWGLGVKIHEQQSFTESSDKVSKDHILRHIHQLL